MSSSDSDDAQSTRPISVAELLARNGTIGAPPAGGRRRRRRGDSQSVSVAELTAEIPVVVVDETPPEPATETTEVVEADAEAEAQAEAEAEEPEPDVEAEAEAEAEAEPEAAAEPAEPAEDELAEVEAGAEADAEPDTDEADTDEADTDEPEPLAEIDEPDAPQLAGDPLPRRSDGPQLSHDPRPLRRPSGAEEMTYDPADESVDLSRLVDEAAGETEAIRSYLQATGGTLFSGQTMADDLAAGRVVEAAATGDAADGPRLGRMASLQNAAAAAGQSVLAVVFGAGLFIGFDQLWRWNTIVALVLSVLVILGLVIAVRVVRKTEDIASTLIAVAVGALVTLGPLALLQSYG